jgi:MOSC domain-containing protein YiiM
MELISVNIGAMRIQPKGDETETTGIYKIPITGPVMIAAYGIPGDFIGDAKNHGGPDQAIYVYGMSDYAWWSEELRKHLEPGTFGENLTISELESASVDIGDRFHIASVVLEVTAPRTPCATLARRMGDLEFAERYRRAERPGLYCRVIRSGEVQAGDPAVLERHEGEGVNVLDLFREHYHRDKDVATLRRFLDSPIAARVRRDLEKDLETLLGRDPAARRRD